MYWLHHFRIFRIHDGESVTCFETIEIVTNCPTEGLLNHFPNVRRWIIGVSRSLHNEFF